MLGPQPREQSPGKEETEAELVMPEQWRGSEGEVPDLSGKMEFHPGNVSGGEIYKRQTSELEIKTRHSCKMRFLRRESSNLQETQGWTKDQDMPDNHTCALL